MKSIITYINEKLVLNKNILNKNTKTKYKYHPKTDKELHDLIEQLIEERGNDGDFNDIDTSEITDMSFLFSGMTEFNGDISKWDVSNVTNMSWMFDECKEFEGKGLENWDVYKVENMNGMFAECTSFNRDLSNWNVSNAKYYGDIFCQCPIEEKYKPKFK